MIEIFVFYMKCINDSDNIVFCTCGCGVQTTINIDSRKYNKYINGHNRRGEPGYKGFLNRHHTQETKERMSKVLTGRKMTCEQNIRNSIAHIGKQPSDTTKEKLSKALTGRTFSDQHRMNLSKSRKGKSATQKTRLILSNAHKGKKDSLETKNKKRISNIKYRDSHIENSGILYPGVGKNETYIIDRIYNGMNRNTVRNNHELYKLCKKFPDNFDFDSNFVVEVLEDHHIDKITGELIQYDLDRQVVLANNLSCMIYYISEKQFFENPEKEIQRFNNFILLLDSGVN